MLRVLLLVCFLSAQLAAQSLLPIDHPRAERIGALLIAVEAGRVDDLRWADPRWWSQPIAYGDELTRYATHWTFRLQELIAQLPPNKRAAAVAQLESLAQRVPLDQRHLFVPAPSALGSLADLADRHFDHGRFADFLRCVELLPYDERLPFARRVAVARVLLQPALDDHFKPGGLRREFLPPAVEDNGLSLRWERDGARLVGLDAQGRVRLQRLFSQVQDMRWQGDLALVLERDRWYCIDAAGRMWSQERQREVDVLGVGGGRLWLQREDGIVGIDAQDTLQLRLPENVFSEPLCWGAFSIWLGPERIMLCRGAELVAVWHHDLDQPQHWRWRLQHQRLVLRHEDGRRLVCGDLAEHDSSPAERIVALLRAERSDEAWGIWDQLPEGEEKLRLWQRLVITQPRPDRRRLLADASGPLALRALARQWQAGDESQNELLLHLAEAMPGTLLPRDQRPSHRPDRWRDVWSAAYLASRLRHDPLPQGELQLARDDAGNHAYRWDDSWLHVEQDERFTTLSCSRQGLLLWRSRWLAPATLPSRSLRMRDGWLLLLEGQHRLHLVDPELGSLASSLRIPSHLALPSQMRIVDPQHVVVLHPIGVNNELSLIEQGGEEQHLRHWQLPGHMRDCQVLGERIVCETQDGESWTLDLAKP